MPTVEHVVEATARAALTSSAAGADTAVAALAGHGRITMRQCAPFAATGALAIVALALTDTTTGGTPALELALGTAAVLGLLALLGGSWRSLAAILVPIAALGLIGVVIDANGGASSGLLALVLLPLMWVALYGSRVQLMASLVMLTLILTLPLIGSDAPESDIRRGLLSVMFAALLGWVTQGLVMKVRAQALDLARIVQVTDRLASGADTRVEVCTALRDSMDGTFAILFEVSRAGLQATAADGTPLPDMTVDVDDAQSPVARAFRAKTRFVIDDRATPVHLGPCTSALFEPVARSGRVQGVVVIGFNHVPKLDGRVVAMLTVMGASAASAIERVRELDKLRYQSMTDTLTGIPNRRGWNSALTPALEFAAQAGSPISVAIFDLDHFKLYNDARGHLAGDALLHRTATAWSKQLRESDVLCRYGGEEFALLLPGCALDAAATLAERLRTSMPSEQTCSAGVACWDGSESTADLVARADRALYRAKREGRDRLVVDSDNPSVSSPTISSQSLASN